MGNACNCCGSKKKEEIEKFKAETRKAKIDIDENRSTAAEDKTPKTPATPGVISMDEDESRLKDLYDALEEQFLYFFDKEFPFPTEKADLIESPDTPILKFDIFYEFYKSAMIWNKILILKKKHENQKKRRLLFKSKDLQAYVSECKL